MTSYRPLTTIQMTDLFDGRLKSFNIHEHQAEATSSTHRCLTDGVNYLWVDCDEDGSVSYLTRWLPNGNPRHILACIAEAFGIDIVSEYEPEYWGFDSQEAWDAALKKMDQESEDEYYAELLKFFAGESCDIRPGTNGMLMAEIAKQLVAQNPELALPANRTGLLAEIDEISKRDREDLRTHHVVAFEIAAMEAAMEAARKRAEKVPDAGGNVKDPHAAGEDVSTRKSSSSEAAD